jgi:hypothetical protein
MARRGFAETLKTIYTLLKDFMEKMKENSSSGSPKKILKKNQWMESLQVSSLINLEDSRFLALEIEEEMFKQCASDGECGAKVSPPGYKTSSTTFHVLIYIFTPY